MNTVERLRGRFYPDESHPYCALERATAELLHPGATLLDAGCGRSAPLLVRLAPLCAEAVGIDVVEFEAVEAKVELLRAGLSEIPRADASVDVVVSRSVLEHLDDPLGAFREIRRVLKPGGRFLFLTPNLWDYGSLAAMVIPNAWHARVVRAVEGRDEQDTFPTRYRANTMRSLRRLASESGLSVDWLRHASQYPNYLQFNALAFLGGVAYERMTRLPGLKWLQGWIMGQLSKPSAGG